MNKFCGSAGTGNSLAYRQGATFIPESWHQCNAGTGNAAADNDHIIPFVSSAPTGGPVVAENIVSNPSPAFHSR